MRASRPQYLMPLQKLCKATATARTNIINPSFLFFNFCVEFIYAHENGGILFESSPVSVRGEHSIVDQTPTLLIDFGSINSIWGGKSPASSCTSEDLKKK